MALFKFAGTKEQLDSVDVHNGFVYVCSDGVDQDEAGNLLGEWYVDIGETRYRLAAAALIDPDGEVVNVEDLLRQTDILEVSQGGLGRNIVTENALLIGGKTEDNVPIVAEVPAAAGILQVTANGEAPTYATAPISLGGTGGTTAAQARTNLDVYSKTEIDNKAITVAYTATLVVENWIENEEESTYSYTLTESRLTCGSNGYVPPIITCTSNVDEYRQIQSAVATPEEGIVFVTETLPTENIDIIIVDNK